MEWLTIQEAPELLRVKMSWLDLNQLSPWRE
jgi:hypothetical protein